MQLTRTRGLLARVGLIQAVLLMVAVMLPGVARADEVPAIVNDYVVVFDGHVNYGEQLEAVAAVGATAVDSVPALRLQVIEATAEQAVALSGGPGVVSVEIDQIRQAEALPNDPDFGDQWALPVIGWQAAYDEFAPQGSARVAVLDTGVDASHPELAAAIATGIGIIEGSDPFADPSGHGTALAGIVAAAVDNAAGIAGVAYAGVEIMPVTVLAEAGTGQDSDIIEGIVWATVAGADVILMAFSNPTSSAALQAAVDYAWARGVVLVAAVGNDGIDQNTYPAGTAGVVGVSATTSTDTLAGFSNSGDSVFVAAPGAGITTTASGGGLTSISGTSAAAAHVAAAAALVMANDPGVSNSVVAARLARNAEAVGTVAETGNGRLDLYRAMADVDLAGIKPAGAPSAGPFVGPYVAAALDIENPVVSPLLVFTSVPTAFSFTVESKNGGVHGVAHNDNPECVVFTLTGFTSLAAASLSQPAGHNWTISSIVGNVVTAKADGTAADQLHKGGEQLTLNVTATAPAAVGTYTWTAAAYNDTACTGGKKEKIADVLVVNPVVSTFSDAALTTPRSVFGSGATVYLVVDGYLPSHTDAEVAWIKPNGTTACANLSGGDRPDTSATGRLPSTGFLQFPPNASGGVQHNDNTKYDSTCLGAGSSFAANPGLWKIQIAPKGQPSEAITLAAFTIDTAAPTVTVNQAAAQADPTGISPINFTVTFSEPVFGFNGSDVFLGSSTAGGVLIAVVTGGPATYNVAVSGMTTGGLVVVSVPAAAAVDVVGLPNAASTSVDNTVTWTSGPTHVAFATSPSSSTHGAAFGTQPVVEIRDALGNVVTTSSAPVTLSIKSGTPATGGPGTLNGTVTVNAVNGVATFSGLSISGAGTGYRLHAVSGALTPADSALFDIGKADPVCSVTGYSVVYDGMSHTASGQCLGVAGEVLSGLDLSGTTRTNAGDFPADPWSFTDVTGNYNNTSGTVANSIGKAILTVTADDTSKVLNGPNPAFTFTYDGFVGGEGPAVIDTAPTCAAPAVTSPVGSYPITCSGGADDNYSFDYINGTLRVLYAVGGTCLGAPGHQVLQPINADYTSVFKKGSTVPVKFRVCDANGVSIGTAGVVTSFRLVASYVGMNGTVLDEIPMSTTPDTEFRWSAEDKQWIFNLKTKNLSTGKTYVYEIMLNDGSYITFAFGLK